MNYSVRESDLLSSFSFSAVLKQEYPIFQASQARNPHQNRGRAIPKLNPQQCCEIFPENGEKYSEKRHK
jgi:hypothetical protein